MITNRLEVVTLMMHFLITIAILGGYLFTVWKGIPDETLKNLLMVIGGYWFGAIGVGKLKDSLTKGKDQGGGKQ